MAQETEQATGIDPKLAAAFVAFQAELTPVKKSADNPFFKSKYADLGAVQRHVQPLLARHKLAVMQPTRKGAEGKLELVTRLVHDSGAYLEEVTEVTVAKSDVQAKGSGITYERRYAYMAMLGVVADDEDDDGNAATSKAQSQEPATNSAEAGATDKQKQLISDKLAKIGIATEEQRGYLIEQYGVDMPLTKEGASFVIEELIGGQS